MFKKVPHTYVIVFSIIVVSAIFTWILQAGEFERTTKVLPDGSEKTIIVEGTYHKVEEQPQTWHVFAAMFKGFENQAGIIIFILLQMQELVLMKLVYLLEVLSG